MHESELMRFVHNKAKEKQITTKKDLNTLIKKIDKKQILKKMHVDLLAKVIVSTNH